MILKYWNKRKYWDQLVIGIVDDLISTINSTTSTNYGTITESNFQVKLSEIDEEAGIEFKVQVDVAWPVLEEIKENGSMLYPDKSKNDIYRIFIITLFVTYS